MTFYNAENVKRERLNERSSLVCFNVRCSRESCVSAPQRCWSPQTRSCRSDPWSTCSLQSANMSGTVRASRLTCENGPDICYSLWHYIWEIKTAEQILWFHRNSPATNEMNIINKLYAGERKKKSNLAYCIGRATNVMVGIVVRGSVCHTEPCKARMSGW